MSYKEIFGYLVPEEADKLFELGKNLPDNFNILEIGSYKGKSTVAILEGAAGKDGIMYCVDAWNNINMFMEAEDTYQDFLNNTKEYQDKIISMRGLSQEVRKEYKGKKFNLIFIDGDHSKEGVANDIKDWVPLLKKGGILAFHDYGGYWTGVKEAIDESGLKFKEPFLVYSLYGGQLE